MELTKQEKLKIEELLAELNELGPEELEFWKIKAQTLLVFIAMRNPQVLFEAPAASGVECG